MKKILILLGATFLLSNAYAANTTIKKNKKISKVTAVAPKSIDIEKYPSSVVTIPDDIAIANIQHLNNSNVNSSISLDKNAISLGVDFSFTRDNGEAIPTEELVPLLNGKLIEAFAINSRFDSIEELPIEWIDSKKEYNIQTTVKEKSCQSIYISYHLKGEVRPTIISAFTDKLGNSVSAYDKDCKGPVVFANSELLYTKHNNTIGIFNDSLHNSPNKLVKYTVIITKNGVTYTPEGLQSYLISEDGKSFYNAYKNTKRVTKVAGSHFEQSLPAGKYDIIVKFDEKDSKEYSYSKVVVFDR